MFSLPKQKKQRLKPVFIRGPRAPARHPWEVQRRADPCALLGVGLGCHPAVLRLLCLLLSQPCSELPAPLSTPVRWCKCEGGRSSFRIELVDFFIWTLISSLVSFSLWCLEKWFLSSSRSLVSRAKTNHKTELSPVWRLKEILVVLYKKKNCRLFLVEFLPDVHPERTCAYGNFKVLPLSPQKDGGSWSNVNKYPG